MHTTSNAAPIMPTNTEPSTEPTSTKPAHQLTNLTILPAANTDAEQPRTTAEPVRPEPRHIASWGHELAQVAVVRFRTLMMESATGAPSTQALEEMRSLASQLRLMADAAVGAQLALMQGDGSQPRLL